MPRASRMAPRRARAFPGWRSRHPESQREVRPPRPLASGPVRPRSHSTTTVGAPIAGTLQPHSAHAGLSEAGMHHLLMRTLHSATADPVAQTQIFVVMHAPGMLAVVGDE